MRDLGMEFQQTDKSIVVNQQKYINNLLEKLGMQNYKSLATQMKHGLKLEKGNVKEIEKPYQNLIDSLMCLAVATRPDISYAVSCLSQPQSTLDSSQKSSSVFNGHKRN